MDVLAIELPEASPGTRHRVNALRFGRRRSGRKAYIQAGIHAHEAPSILVAHHLAERLERAESEGRIEGEILLVPIANPLGLGQFFLGAHQGRYCSVTGRDHNRGWPDVAEEVATATLGRLGSKAAQNRRIIEEAIASALAQIAPEWIGSVDALQHRLLSLAHDADVVIDLHSDGESELGIFVGEEHWPAAASIAGRLSARIVQLTGDGVTDAFDEMVVAPFLACRAAQRKKVPIPIPFAMTVELRGDADVRDDLAGEDASALLDCLIERGAVSGTVRARRFRGAARPVDRTIVVVAPSPGVLVHHKDVGDRVRRGEVVAEIVDPLATPPRAPVRAAVAGRLFSRVKERVVYRGAPIAKIQASG